METITQTNTNQIKGEKKQLKILRIKKLRNITKHSNRLNCARNQIQKIQRKFQKLKKQID